MELILLQSVVTDDEDGNELKLDKKNSHLFFQVLKPCLEKIAKKKTEYGLLSLLNFNGYFLRNSAGAFCVRVKVLSNDFGTEVT